MCPAALLCNAEKLLCCFWTGLTPRRQSVCQRARRDGSCCGVARNMLFCKTQPALVATFAAGITWYLNPAARRWSRLQLHARRGQPPPSRAAPVPVEKRARGPTLQHHPQYQLDVLPAAAVGPKRTRSVMSAALVSEPESPATVHARNQASASLGAA